MKLQAVALLDETHCEKLDAFLADRVYEFNSELTGYIDGKLLGGSIRNCIGEVIAGFSGHTWGGCCVIAHLWVHAAQRGRGLGLVAEPLGQLRRRCGPVRERVEKPTD